MVSASGETTHIFIVCAKAGEGRSPCRLLPNHRFSSSAIAPELQRRATEDPETYQAVTDGDICARFCSKPRAEADIRQSPPNGTNEQFAEPCRLFSGLISMPGSIVTVRPLIIGWGIGEDGKRSTMTLGAIERLAGENLGVICRNRANCEPVFPACDRR
jgi:hypothetical protein